MSKRRFEVFSIFLAGSICTEYAPFTDDGTATVADTPDLTSSDPRNAAWDDGRITHSTRCVRPDELATAKRSRLLVTARMAMGVDRMVTPTRAAAGATAGAVTETGSTARGRVVVVLDGAVVVGGGFAAGEEVAVTAGGSSSGAGALSFTGGGVVVVAVGLEVVVAGPAVVVVVVLVGSGFGGVTVAERSTISEPGG